MSTFMKLLSMILVFSTASFGSAFADAMTAFVSADDAAYADGWDDGDGGGSGWGGNWSLFTSSPPDPGSAGHFIGTSAINGFGDGDIDTSGSSFGLYANNSYTASAVRPFDGTLGVGQSVIVRMDNGFIDNGSSVGFTLTGFGDPMSTEQFSFYFRGGETNYNYSNGQMIFLTEYDTGVDYTSGGLEVVFTLTDTDSYSVDITPNGGATTSLTGDFLIDANIDHIELYNYNAGSGSDNDAFFNSIQIVPEPATLSMMLLGVFGLLRARRRR